MIVCPFKGQMFITAQTTTTTQNSYKNKEKEHNVAFKYRNMI